MTKTYWKIQCSTDGGKTWEQKYTLTQYDSFEKAEKSKNYIVEKISKNNELYRVVRTEETVKEFVDDGGIYHVEIFSKYAHSRSWEKDDTVKFYSESEARDFIKKKEDKDFSCCSDTAYSYELKALK